jgi:hypothetical protein
MIFFIFAYVFGSTIVDTTPLTSLLLCSLPRHVLCWFPNHVSPQSSRGDVMERDFCSECHFCVRGSF